MAVVQRCPVTLSLFSIVVIGRDHSVIQEYTKVFFLIDAVSENFPDRAVMCDLTVLLFYPFEISVNLLLKFSLTLLSPARARWHGSLDRRLRRSDTILGENHGSAGERVLRLGENSIRGRSESRDTTYDGSI